MKLCPASFLQNLVPEYDAIKFYYDKKDGYTMRSFFKLRCQERKNPRDGIIQTLGHYSENKYVEYKYKSPLLSLFLFF